MKKLISFFSVLAALVAVHAGTVDFTSSPGPVKPVHSVGQPPLSGDMFGEWRMMRYLKEANIPYSRLHDVGATLGCGGLFVDVPNLFPDFAADETDPASYRFAYTDSLLAAMVKNGVEPFFRLGVSIEGWVRYTGAEHAGDYPRINIEPPADYAKWARICEHIINHYNNGWADGFHFGITYWEIWNEPEQGTSGKMWNGTWSQYCAFYGTVATYLKDKFPSLKFGGYAAIDTNIYHDQFVSFLGAVRDNNWPLDFFSYHSYAPVSSTLGIADTIDAQLSDYGFTRDKTERILNEWLPSANTDKLGTTLQATEVASEIIGFQNGPVDLACIYDARSRGGSNWNSLFNADTLEPYPAYYSVKAFGELYALGTAASCLDFPSSVSVAAATDGKGGNRAILVATGISFNTANLNWGEDAQLVKAVNVTAGYVEQDTMPATLAKNSVWLFRLYDENGATPGISATVTGVSGRAGEGPFSCSLSVINPTTGWEATWYDETGAECGVTAPEYDEEGTYTNVVKVTAAGYPDFYGTGVVTVAAAPAANLTVVSANGEIAVTVPADVVTESTPVYLVWDTSDKGNDLADWTNKANLGDVTAAGGTFNVTGATHSIANGAAIRAFVMAGDKVDLYASLTKPKAVSGLVDLGYSPGKTVGTSGIDIDFKIENLSLGSGVTYIFFGICDYSSEAATEAGNSWGENFHVACGSSANGYYSIHVRPQANDHKTYKGDNYMVTPPNAQTLEVRHVLRARTGEVPSLLLGGVTAYSAASSWPSELTWDYAPGTVAVFGRNENPPKAESPRYFQYGDMTLYGLKIYEKKQEAHVCVRDYVPAAKNGTKGLYETISGGFYPASAANFTLGGSATNTVGGVVGYSAAATYSAAPAPRKKQGLIIYGTR